MQTASGMVSGTGYAGGHEGVAAIVDGHAKNGDEEALTYIATAKGTHPDAIRARAGMHLIILHSAKGDDGALDGLRHIATSGEFAPGTRTDAGLKLIDLHSHPQEMDVGAIRWLATDDRCAPAVRDAAGARLVGFYATCGDDSGRRGGLGSIANDPSFTSATRQAARNELDAIELAPRHAADADGLGKRQPRYQAQAAKRIPA